MKTPLPIKFAVAASALGLGLLAALPAGAQTTVPPETATLTVTKTVEGTAPAGTTFTLHISCSGGSIEPVKGDHLGAQTDYDEDMTFGATGGSKDFIFTDFSTCEITETDDGGADSNSGPVSVDITAPTLFDAEIVNTFDPTPTTAPPAEEAAVQAAPAFTG